WRTALVIRELEDDIISLRRFAPEQERLSAMMARKEELESDYSTVRLALQRKRHGYGPDRSATEEELEAEMLHLRERLLELDEEIAPLAREAGRLLNPNWRLLMRTGNHKSHCGRQGGRYSDVYTGRVSSFLHPTSDFYPRSHRGSLPHDL